MSVTKNQAAAKAIQWIKNHRVPGSGILTHHNHTVASQEVTGYIIETLFHVGEKELAKDLARWEASVQRMDGAFSAPDGTPPRKILREFFLSHMKERFNDIPGDLLGSHRMFMVRKDAASRHPMVLDPLDRFCSRLILCDRHSQFLSISIES